MSTCVVFRQVEATKNSFHLKQTDHGTLLTLYYPIPQLWQSWEKRLMKTLWEKGKVVITKIFITHIPFLLSKTNITILICNLTLSKNKPWVLRVCRKSLLKTLWEKEKLLVTSNFSFSRSGFYLFGELSTIFNQF